MQTIVIVAVITALIWLYAEANTTQSRTIVVKVRFVQPPAKKLYIDQPAGGYDVNVEFNGTSEQISSVEKLVADPIELEITPTTSDGQSPEVVPFIDRIRSHEPLRTLGIEIKEVKPASQDVWVWELVERKLRIEAEATGGVVLTGDPQIEPSDATVMLPVSLEPEDLDQISLVVRIGSDPDQSNSPGAPNTLPFAVELSDDLDLLPPGYDPEPTPARVDVTFTISDQREEWTPPRVPVKLLLPPDDVGKYTVHMKTVDKGDETIKLRIPRDIKQSIEKGDLDIKLIVSLSAQDLAKGKWAGTPILILPHGVTNETPPKVITMTFKPVSSAVEGTLSPAGDSDSPGAE